MKFLVKYLRKIVVAIIGTIVLIIGIILIPLPGPGLLICLAALFIYSLEFDWVKPHIERLKKQLKELASPKKKP